LLNIFNLSASFATVFASLPFLDFILAKNPDEYQKITNYIFSAVEYLGFQPSFIVSSIILLITVFLKSITEICYQYYCQKLQYIFMEKEGSELNKKVFNMDQIFYFKFSSSRVLNIFIKELERASQIISVYFVTFNAFLQLIIYLAVPIYLNAQLTVLFFFILAILLLPLILINLKILRLGIQTTEITNDLFKTLSNNLNSSKFISVHGLIKNANKHFLKSFSKYAKNKINLYVWGSTIRNYLQPIGILSIIIPLSFLLEYNELSVVGAILWSLTRTLNPVGVLLDGIRTVNSEIPALKNLYQTKYDFNQFQITNGSKKIENIDEILLKDVEFSYGSQEIYKKLNFKISKGEKIAIIGETGSGKSTFLDILTNVAKINSGNRTINNTKFEDIDFIDFRKKISYIPQSLLITDSTVEEFFNFFNDEIKTDKINYYLDLMGCNKFLKEEKNILNVYLGDKGMRLSGGQKQKIILAAALSRNPDILILDETTNALDAINEDVVIKKILSDKKLILIFISHKLSKTDYFDKIYMVDEKNLKLNNNH